MATHSRHVKKCSTILRGPTQKEGSVWGDVNGSKVGVKEGRGAPHTQIKTCQKEAFRAIQRTESFALASTPGYIRMHLTVSVWPFLAAW